LTLQECALLTDGRFSGGSHGFVVGHICPEAQVNLFFIFISEAIVIGLQTDRMMDNALTVFISVIIFQIQIVLNTDRISDGYIYKYRYVSDIK
jgi:Dehydratase family